MDRLYRPSRIRQEPIIGVVWVLALAAIIGGLYILSPFLVLTPPTGSSAIYNSAASWTGLLVLASAAVVSGLWMIYGIKKDRPDHIRRGLLLNIILRVYAALVSIVAYGALTSWISVFTLLAIDAIIYVALRKR